MGTSSSAPLGDPLDEENPLPQQDDGSAHRGRDPYAALAHVGSDSPVRRHSEAGAQAEHPPAAANIGGEGIAADGEVAADYSAGHRAYNASQFPHIPAGVSLQTLLTEGLRPDLTLVPFQMARSEAPELEDDEAEQEAAERKRKIVRCHNPFHLVRSTLQLRPAGPGESLSSSFATAAAASSFASPTIAVMPANHPQAPSSRKTSRGAPALPPKPVANSSSPIPVAVASASGVYTLEFAFECLLPTRISVHWLAEEVTDDEDGGSSGRGRIAYLGQESAAPQVFPKGRHHFSLPPEFALRSAGLSDAQLREQPGAFYWPLVVVMEEAESQRSRLSRISHLTTYCSLQRSSSSSAAVATPSLLSVKVLRTTARVEPDGLTFEVQEVYGMKGETSSAGTSGNHDDDEEEKAGPYSAAHATIATPNTAHVDCLVCMSEPRDTAIIPCRHFCVCSECARTLKQQTPPRCPVCRTPIQTTVKIAKLH